MCVYSMRAPTSVCRIHLLQQTAISLLLTLADFQEVQALSEQIRACGLLFNCLEAFS